MNGNGHSSRYMCLICGFAAEPIARPHYAETLGYFLEESLHAVKMRDLSADDEYEIVCPLQASR